MGGEDPDPRDDVHALGVIWYQLLVGDLTVRPPAESRDKFADRQVPEAIVRLIGSCISSKAEKRPADAGVLAEEIDELVCHPAATAAAARTSSRVRPTTRGGECPGT